MWTVLFVSLLLLSCGTVRCATTEESDDNIVVATTNASECPAGDDICEKDRIGFEAIHHLHRQIDDDQNGNLDRSESDETSPSVEDEGQSSLSWERSSPMPKAEVKMAPSEVKILPNLQQEFIRDELKYEDGFERHSNFHGSDDLISIDDLWKLWIQSDVYNWTVDDVADWLVNHVELPQYLEHVKVNAVDGRTLPRIAGNSQYVINILGIKSLIHRQKLSIKAMDLVLFGAPKRHNWIKDLVLVGSLLIACGGCWLAYVQHRYSQSHLRKVMKDLETLRSDEEAFTKLQQELQEAKKTKQHVEEQQITMEKTLKCQMEEYKTEADRLRTQRESTEEEIQRWQLAEEELEQMRSALRRAEKELENARLGAVPLELQPWLQLTYEIETKHYDHKREAAERQLAVAKEMCEKIRKKRSAFLGSLRIAHTTSIDDTDHMIMSARTALEEMKVDLQERSQRWQQIEYICGFAIQQNPGQMVLETVLKAGHANYTGASSSLLSSRSLSGSMMAPLNMDDADEDYPPGALTNTVAFFSQPGRRCHTLSQSAPGMMALHPPQSSLALTRTSENVQTQICSLASTHDSTSPAGADSDRAMPTIGRGSPLASTLGGSTNSVSTTSRQRPPLSTIPSQESDSELPRSDSEDNVSNPSSVQLSSAGASANGGVSFDLGGPTENLAPVDDRTRANSVGKSYKTSVSVDSGTTSRTMPRPRTLPTSLSEGSFKGLPSPLAAAQQQTQATSGGTRAPPPVIARTSSSTASSTGPGTPTLSVDDNSSPESTDGSNTLTGDRPKRKKKNPFKKFLGHKQKTS